MPGVDPFTIAAISAAVSGITGIAGAVEQNRQADKRDDAARKAADTQTGQLRAQASFEAQRKAQEARRIRGAILARDSVAGDALLNQVDADLAINLDVLTKNRDAALARVASGLDATLSESNRSNAVLSGITGSIGGFGAGLSIANSFPAQPAPAPTGGAIPSLQQSGPSIPRFGDPLQLPTFA